MNLIIPMAGRGSRLRPHTLTTPKPLIKIAGKSIVKRLVEDINKMLDDKIEEIAFIIGDFGHDIENELLNLAKSVGSVGKIYKQDIALGTAHAINCAKESLNGKIIIAFADTLFKSEFQINTENDGVLWVKYVDDPKAFGVVKLNENNMILGFVEKPQQFVSNLAIIGIYYIKNAEELKTEINYLIDNNITTNGEFQLTDALENMRKNGNNFSITEVNQWMDCGNKINTIETNTQLLKNDSSINQNDVNKLKNNIIKNNSLVLEPSFIGNNVEMTNSVIGPYASIGDNTKINNSVISNSIVQENTQILNAVISNSMIGNNTIIKKSFSELSVGDYNEITD